VNDGFLNLPDVLVIRVLLTRPEESAQAVFAATRHDVHVQMRNALADRVVDGHESPLGVHRLLDSVGKDLHVGKEWGQQVRGKIRQRRIVLAWNQQHVARENGTVVEKGGRDRVGEDDER